MVDTQRDMISRAPSYYTYTAICGGLAFFDWDGVENLTPDQLFGWYVAGYSPGVNDTEVDATSVEQYFYAYTGYHLEIRRSCGSPSITIVKRRLTGFRE